MISDEQCILIDASEDVVWTEITNIEGGYSYEHDSVEILSEDKSFRDGLRFREQERIGGIVANVEAEVFNVQPVQEWSFRGHAIYHHLGLRVRVQEGGTFYVKSVGSQTELTLRAWGQFPKSLFGKCVEFYAKKVLKIPRSLAEHNLGELRDFKAECERNKT